MIKIDATEVSIRTIHGGKAGGGGHLIIEIVIPMGKVIVMELLSGSGWRRRKSASVGGEPGRKRPKHTICFRDARPVVVHVLLEVKGTLRGTKRSGGRRREPVIRAEFLRDREPVAHPVYLI